MQETAQKVVDILKESRCADLHTPKGPTNYPALTEEDEDDANDEVESVRGWVFLDQRVYREPRNDYPELRGERLHLKVVVGDVVDDTPFAASLINKQAKRGEVTAAVKQLMSDPRLRAVNRESVKRIFRTIRTGK